jgi:RNA-splicing ligase RtcB
MAPSQHGNVLSWATDLDPAALDQAAKTARLDFVAGPVALMPDAHVGLGATVGSVISTDGAIIPAAVGVDIGCGMIAVETDLTSTALPDDLAELHTEIARVVPAGVGRGHRSRRERRASRAAGGLHRGAEHWPARRSASELSERLEAKAVDQFGTLGSGNHFVEVCLDERDVVWVVLHSGSRGVGNELATHHIDTAKGLMREWMVELEDPNLAYLVEGSPQFEAYIADMLWAQDYALGNRETMMDAVLDAVRGTLGGDAGEVAERARINCHHNYTVREHHRGRDVWLTRKGAIRARGGDRGVIPGSMGTSSYIVRGLGNPASYDSCSHGAGRRMSRGQARRQLDVAGLRTRMAGKAWNQTQAGKLLDEDPRSYKDIDQVMADQADLVTVDHSLTQILNYKGT